MASAASHYLVDGWVCTGLQADIGADFLRQGIKVRAFNERNVASILTIIRMVDASQQAEHLVGTLDALLAEARTRVKRFPRRA